MNVRAVANTNINQVDAAFEKYAPYSSCITKINNTLIGNAEDLDIVISMHNLLEYSHSYSITSGSLWNCYREEIDSVDDDVLDDKSFEYKTKIIGKTPA